MAVRIRMKRTGRRNRPFYRICAVDSRSPRDGKVIEELGHYDPMVREVDARAIINGERLAYWLKVGALPSERVAVLVRKYGPAGTHVTKQKEALARLSVKRAQPAPQVGMEKKPKAAAAAAEAVEAAT